MTAKPVLPSLNESNGFFGAITACPLRERRSSEVWALASTLIAKAVRARSEEDRIGIREFLDSRMGRHFADDVAGALESGVTNSETAIKSTIAKWQGWRICMQTQRLEGIQAGLPYLTGWVQHFATERG
jgi:hypothetical protein